MTQAEFQNSVNRVIGYIENEYFYDHVVLQETIYSKIFDNLNYSLEKFDTVEGSYKEMGRNHLQINFMIFSENKLIQEVNFII